MKDLLVVVDLQTDWLSDSGNYTNRLSRFFRHIRKVADYRVIVLEYKGFGNTLESVTNVLERTFSNVDVLIKRQQDGSSVIARKLHYKPHKVTMVGCFLDQCVQETALGLMRRDYKVKVINDLCIPSGTFRQTKSQQLEIPKEALIKSRYYLASIQPSDK